MDTVYSFDQTSGDQVVPATSGGLSAIVATQNTDASGNIVITFNQGSGNGLDGITHD